MSCIYMTRSTIYKSDSNACHPVSTAVVLVSSDRCGDGYSKSPLHYAITLASSWLLGLYIKLSWSLPHAKLCVSVSALKCCIP